MKGIIWSLFLVTLVNGQICANYGVQNGSTCSCPTGFGGSTCSQPGCGGDIFQGSQRHLASASGGSFPNLTASGCSCESGWTGTGCNVCQTTSACQTGYNASGNAISDSQAVSDAQNGQNDTLVCNTEARVWAASQMSCQVNVSLTPNFFYIRINSTGRILLFKPYTLCPLL